MQEKLKNCKAKQKIYSGTNDFVNACMVAACFDPAERLFQSFAPLKEKDFWPFTDFFMGSLKSFSVLRRLLEQRFEFFINVLLKYCGASWC